MNIYFFKVNGEFVCLGDPESLKARYAQGIFVEVFGGSI
jgi:hypothetical protein